MRPEPGLAGDRAAHAEARQAAEQRQQAALAARVPPGQRRQPLLRQRPPHALVVQGEALRVPRPLLQRPVLPDLLGHGGDGPRQLLAGHGGPGPSRLRPGPARRFLPARKAPRRSARRAELGRRPARAVPPPHPGARLPRTAPGFCRPARGASGPPRLSSRPGALLARAPAGLGQGRGAHRSDPPGGPAGCPALWAAVRAQTAGLWEAAWQRPYAAMYHSPFARHACQKGFG